MTPLRLSRSARVWGSGLALTAAGLALPAAASAATASSGNVTVSAATKAPATASLRTAKVKVTGVRPASVKRSRWTLPVSGASRLDAKSVDLNGRLRFARGKRNVTFTSLRLSLGKKPALSGTVGKRRRITILTLSGAPKRDAAAGTISLKGARTTLSSTAVRTLRKSLETSRIKAGRLGSTTATVRVKVPVPGPVTPAPAPVPQPTVPTPGVPIDPGGLPPEPQPEPVCWVPTPTDATDWIGCGAQTGGRLKTWIDYIRGAGTITPTGIAPTGSGPYDYRLTVSTAVARPDGSATISHAGQVRYYKQYAPGLELDVTIKNLRLEVTADRTRADVHLDATYNSITNPTAPPTNVVGAIAMTVDLTAVRSTTPSASGTLYEVAPAHLTPVGVEIWSDQYTPGTPFGAFTFTVPNAEND